MWLPCKEMTAAMISVQPRVIMHIRDIMKVLHQIPGKKIVKWQTNTKSGTFDMEGEFVTSISVMRLAKIWGNEKVVVTVTELTGGAESYFTFA